MLDFALVIPDCHIPYENKAAFELMLRVCSFYRIKIIIILGDFIDCYQFSFYEHLRSLGSPRQLWLKEKSEARQRLNQLERFNAGKQIYLEGNHEVRLKRFINRQSSVFGGDINIPNSLELYNWQYIPFTAFQKYQLPGTNIFLKHTPPTGGQALNIAKQSGATTIYGHTHAISDATFINKLTDTKCRAINLGNLVNERHKVFDYVAHRPNWAMAFGLISHLQTIHTIHIEKDDKGLFCVFGDKEYR